MVERLLADTEAGSEVLGAFALWAGVLTEVAPGEAALIPRGAVHQFANRGDVDAKALAIATPGVSGPDFFWEAGAILAAAGGPPDLAALVAVMRRHGLTPAA